MKRLICVNVANGLDALTLILLADGVGGRPKCWCRQHLYRHLAGGGRVPWAPPVPVSQTSGSRVYNDPVAAAAAITSGPKAILAVHLYGQPADYAGLGCIGSGHGTFV